MGPNPICACLTLSMKAGHGHEVSRPARRSGSDMRAQGAACFRFPIINRRAGSMPAVRTRKEDNYGNQMLDPGLPAGKTGIRCGRRSSFADAHRQHHAVAGHSGSRGGGSGVNAEKDVCCIASTQTNAERLMNTAPTLSRDKDRTIVGYNSFCLAGNFVDRNTNQNGSGVRENASFTLNTQDRHAVAYDARNSRLNGTVSGTLQAKESGGWSLNYINPVIQPDVLRLPEWIVRRLLPMECGRLQGFPDGWGEIAPLANETEIQFWREVYLRNCKIKGQKPKKIIARADGARSDAAVKKWHDELHSPSAEYSMWGNGMALPNALFFVQNAFRELGKPAAEVKLGSLFDGSGTHAAVCRDVRRAGCVGKRSGALPDCCYQDTPAGDATPRQHNGHQRRSDRAGGHHHFRLSLPRPEHCGKAQRTGRRPKLPVL